MSTVTSKYAVPFNNRKSTVLDNVITQIIDGGTGYLKIYIPVLPSTDNSIGFKIKVFDNNYDNTAIYTPLFEGHISGNSSDGYRWLYSSSIQNENFAISRKPTLFCSYLIDKDNEAHQYLKYIAIGDKSTNWGYKITIKIEYLSSTLVTTPDKEGKYKRKKKTSDISEYSVESAKLVDGDKISYTEGWRFEVSSNDIPEDDINSIINPLEEREGSNIELTGVVLGTSINQEGKLVINTRYPSSGIDIGSKYIIADGSKLTNLRSNETITSIINRLGKFDNPITIESNNNSDVILRYSFDGSESDPIINDVSIRKFKVGSWTESNKNKVLSVKTATSINTINSSDLKLDTGELGALLSNNTDLFLGTTSGNKLVGAVDFINSSSPIPDSSKIEGKLVLHGTKLKLFSSIGAESDWITISSGSGGSFTGTLDDITDGSGYKKIKSDSVSDGSIIKLKLGNGSFLTSDSINTHILDKFIHITSEERNKWNSMSSSNGYSKSEVDNLLSKKSDINHYHGWHNPVSEVVESSSDSHNYPEGKRILSKSDKKIKVSAGPNKWSFIEDFDEGDIVISTDSYSEWINKNGSIIENKESGLVTEDYLNNKLKSYLTLDTTNVNLKSDNWYINSKSSNKIIEVSSNSISLGNNSSTISLLSNNRIKWGSNELATLSDINNLDNLFADKNHYHRFHDPVINILSSDPSSKNTGDRYIINNIIKEWNGTKWITESSNNNDIVYNINNKSIYVRLNGIWILSLAGPKSGTGINIDSNGFINHTNKITKLETNSKLITISSLDSEGHITSYKYADSNSLPNISTDKLYGVIGIDLLPEMEIKNTEVYSSENNTLSGIASLGHGLELDFDPESVDDEGIIYRTNKFSVSNLPSSSYYYETSRDEEGGLIVLNKKITYKGIPNSGGQFKGLKYIHLTENSTGLSGLSSNLDLLQLSNDTTKAGAILIDRDKSEMYLLGADNNTSGSWSRINSLSISWGDYE